MLVFVGAVTREARTIAVVVAGVATLKTVGPSTSPAPCQSRTGDEGKSGEMNLSKMRTLGVGCHQVVSEYTFKIHLDPVNHDTCMNRVCSESNELARCQTDRRRPTF